MAPEANHRAFEDLVLIPLINGAALCAVLDVKSCRALHVKAHHVVICMATEGAREFDVGRDASIVAEANLINVIHFGHDVNTTGGVGQLE